MHDAVATVPEGKVDKHLTIIRLGLHEMLHEVSTLLHDPSLDIFST